MAGEVARSPSFDDNIAILAGEFPMVDLESIAAVLVTSPALVDAREAIMYMLKQQRRSERKSKDKSKSKSKSKQKAKSKSKSKSGKEKRKEERKRLQKEIDDLREKALASGMTAEEFQLELEQEERSRLVAVSNMASVDIINQPRPGKKLLVLDMDYTLLDFKSDYRDETDFERLKRPFLDEFLTAVYKEYDLVVWSQTTWQRLERMLTALGVLTNDNYKFVFVVDRSAMYRVTTRRKSSRSRKIKTAVHEVKDLHYIWGIFPQFYNPCNTIHIDDVDRNFAMNPDNGLTITPFDAELRRSGSDTTLLRLTKYLLSICHLDDFSALNHNEWELYLRNLEDASSDSEFWSGDDESSELVAGRTRQSGLGLEQAEPTEPTASAAPAAAASEQNAVGGSNRDNDFWDQGLSSGSTPQPLRDSRAGTESVGGSGGSGGSGGGGESASQPTGGLLIDPALAPPPSHVSSGVARVESGTTGGVAAATVDDKTVDLFSSSSSLDSFEFS